MKGVKTPLCDNCKNKMYVVNIRRESIGFICPDCDYYHITAPTKHLDDLRETIQELKESKPKFKQRIDTFCGECGKSKFVKCRKNTKKPFKGQGYGESTWVCWCENPIHKKEPAWSQNRGKIMVVPYYQKTNLGI